MDPVSPTRTRRVIAAAVTACVILGAALRFLYCLTEFWLDEIWSVLLLKTGKINGWWDIVVNLRHDNNHIANTLFIYLVGDTQNWGIYRLPALFAGVATVVLMWWIARRRSPAEGLFAAALTAFSFPLILYSSEARGYGPAIFFSLLAFHALSRHLESPSLKQLLTFHAASALAAFSHLSFVHVYLSLIAWSLVRVARRPDAPKAKIRALAAIHLPPLAVLGFLYAAYVHGLKIGGGPHYTVFHVTREAAALAVGAPETGIPAYLGLAAAVLIAALGIMRLARQKDDIWIFHLCVLLLAPALVLLVEKPEVLYFRYFIVCFPFFYLLAARLLAEAWAKPPGARAVAAVLLSLFLVGQAAYSVRFHRYGRGGYFKALKFVAANTRGPAIVVGSSDDYVNCKVLTYYSQFLPKDRGLYYVDRENLPRDPPEWFFVDVHEPGAKPEKALRIPLGHDYRFVAAFRYSGFSGFDWFVYHRET